MSRKTVEHMTWHVNCHNENEKIFHLTCGEAWKHFDSTHPKFATKPRNVRLGLCTDGFTPFGHSASPYSCWAVFVLVYNLPPTMCMKQEYVFLSLIIQVAYLGMECCLGGAHMFLPPEHPFRRSKNDFIKGRIENGTMPERLSGDEMRSRIHWLLDVLFGKPLEKQEIHRFGEVHNWVNDMAIWQERIVEIICKLEQIFPPSFFDSMEHLVIHLPYEAHVGGSVQF
ncbi:hypothetical protein SLEP1_g9721 [Rubroshorea leprosula]|uniref:DUF4218 domain-containing protein n=1 Tax=Rubroshorea leprosula TaxID=152421 RepID=A0AAV5IBR8_9ROSI|nr:hypothetical protein SLEP1_g9721 [Rubroshorea leprosula]